MSLLKEVRQKLGFTQVEIAQFTGLGRSRISLIELGVRELPSDAYEALADLLVNSQQPPPALQEDHEVSAFLKELQWQAAKAQKELDEALEKREQAQHRMAAFGRSRHPLAGVWFAQAKKELSNLSPAKIAFMKSRIAGLQAQRKALLKK